MEQKKIIRAPLIYHLEGEKASVYILVTICLFPLNHVYTNKCAGAAPETEVRFVPAAIYNFTTEETRYQPTTTDSRKTKTTTDSRFVLQQILF